MGSQAPSLLRSSSAGCTACAGHQLQCLLQQTNLQENYKQQLLDRCGTLGQTKAQMCKLKVNVAVKVGTYVCTDKPNYNCHIYFSHSLHRISVFYFTVYELNPIGLYTGPTALFAKHFRMINVNYYNIYFVRCFDELSSLGLSELHKHYMITQTAHPKQQLSDTEKYSVTVFSSKWVQFRFRLYAAL